MSSTQITAPPVYRHGETVNVTIPSAKVVSIYGGRIVVSTDDGTQYEVPTTVAISRVTPADGEPKPGELWSDASGAEWYVTGRSGSKGWVMARADGWEDSWPKVNESYGPLTRTHRPTQADTALDYGIDLGPTPADLPPFVLVEVVEQSPGRSVTLLQIEDNRTWVAYGVGGHAPSWLADVPEGKAVLVRPAYDSPTGAWTFTDWVEPADDHCAPRWGNEKTEWEIGGDGTCVLPQWGDETPADAVARHNKWLEQVVPAEVVGDFGPVTPPARPTMWHLGDREPTGVLQVQSSNADLWDFDEETGRWSHPCDDGSGMSITVVWDDLLHDGPLVQTLPKPPAVDSPTVSPERDSGWGEARRLEIVANLNGEHGDNYNDDRSPFRDYISKLAEFRQGSDHWNDGFVVAFELTDGTEIRRTRRPLGPWAVSAR